MQTAHEVIKIAEEWLITPFKSVMVLKYQPSLYDGKDWCRVYLNLLVENDENIDSHIFTMYLDDALECVEYFDEFFDA
jgi:hypothetical protein